MENQILQLNSLIDLMSLLLTEKEILASSTSIKKKTYKKQEYIYHFGDHADEVYIVKKGSVRIENNDEYARTIIKDVYTKGELFGEASLNRETSRADFAIAREATELFVFSPDELYRQMQNNYALSVYMIKLLGSRLIAAERKMESVVFKNSRARVIDFLYDLAKKRGQRVGYEILVRNFFTHQEIANLTATSRQTVTTVLNELRNKEILTFNRRRLLIRDLNLLENAAS